MWVFRVSQWCKEDIWSSGMWCYTIEILAPSSPLKCWEPINSNGTSYCRAINFQFILDTKVDDSWDLDLCLNSHIKDWNIVSFHLKQPNCQQISIVTFLLFPTLSLVADFDGTHWENDGNDEEEDTTHNTCSYGLMFDSCWHRVLHLFTAFVTFQRIGQYSEIVGTPTNQVLHCWPIYRNASYIFKLHQQGRLEN